MDPLLIVLIMLAALVVLIVLGIHVGVALGATAMVGTYLIFKRWDLAFIQVGTGAYSILRNQLFAVIPLFVLMGEFTSKSGAAGDLYRIINRVLRRVPGRLAVATVTGNAAFAAVTGTSLASAAMFSRVAYPEMIRHGYVRRYALGTVAGSASLGMLIPPSVLMIVWGIVTEVSIGKLFLSGIVPGLMLAVFFAVYCIAVAVADPDAAPAAAGGSELTGPIRRTEIVSGLGVLLLIVAVLGGIWAGFVTATESAAVGALGALVLALAKGVRWDGIKQAIVASGNTIAPILFLILTGQLYARLLAIGNVPGFISDVVTDGALSRTAVFLLMVAVWLILGTLLDSVSIILLTVPIFWPVAQQLGFDPLAYAVIGILAIEAGLLTPPFGLLVYAVKGTVDDPDVRIGEIFAGSIPYWILMLVAMLIVWAAPLELTFLAR